MRIDDNHPLNASLFINRILRNDVYNYIRIFSDENDWLIIYPYIKCYCFNLLQKDPILIIKIIDIFKYNSFMSKLGYSGFGLNAFKKIFIVKMANKLGIICNENEIKCIIVDTYKYVNDDSYIKRLN